MKFQVIKPFSVTFKGRTTSYDLGQRISETRYNKLPKRIQETYFTTARKAATLNAYTNEERHLIASLYNEGNTRKYIVDMFRKLFGNTHSVDSIGQKVEMCKSVDKTLTNNNQFQFRDEELIIMLQDLDCDRYQLA